MDRRSRDRVIAGVAGGLGDYFNIDPAIFRLAFVALMFFGGAGVPLYGLAWLLLPERGTGRSIADGLVDRFSSGNKPAGRVIVALIALIVVINIGGEWLWAALLIGLGVLLFRKDRDGDARSDDGGTGPATARRTDTTPVSEQPNAAPVSPPDTTPPTTGTEGAERSTAGVPESFSEARSSNPYDDAYYADVLTAPPASPTDDGWRPTPLSSPPQPPPPASMLGRLTVAAVLIVIGVVALLDTLTGLDVTPARYAALALTIVGAGLLVGARWGRARGLIALGAVTLMVLVGLTVSAAAPFRLPTASTDPLIYTPATVAELAAGDYDLGFGELRIDLTQLDLNPGQQVALDASVGFGSLEVIVPDDVALTGQAEARMGDINVLGDTRDGAPATMIVNEPGGEGSPTIALDLHAGFGEIDVRETAVQSPDEQRPGLQPAEEGI